MSNAYPELPIIPYKRTLILMDGAVEHIKMLNLKIELSAAVYTVFRFETKTVTISGQQYKAGINNNYCGIQADGARWPEEFTHLMDGVVILRDNKQKNGSGGDMRAFISFKDMEGGFSLQANRFYERGLFMGGTTSKYSRISIHTPEDFAIAYKREWVTGNSKYMPTEQEIKNIAGTYRQGLKLF